MKQRKMGARNILNTVNQKTDMIPGVPLLEIAGECRVLIENHRGIMEYSPQQIIVRVKFGTYCIRGSGLQIAKMGKDQLVILGRIEAVQLDRRC